MRVVRKKKKEKLLMTTREGVKPVSEVYRRRSRGGRSEVKGTGQLLMSTKEGVRPESEVYPTTETLEPTEEPLLTVTPARSLGEQYKTSTAGYQLPFTGTLGFAGQKVSGWLTTSKYSPVAKTGYAKSVSGLTTPIIEIGPYFSPIGSVLMLGTGAETILTPAGRGKVFETSKTLKKDYNIPTYVSTPTQFLGAGAMTYFGGKGTLKSTEKILKLPKTETRLLGVQQRIADKKVITDIAFETKTKTLFGGRTDIGFARGVSKIKPIGEFQTTKTLTVGKFVPKGYNLPKGIAVGKPTTFSAMSFDISKPTKTLTVGKSKGLTISKPVEGFKQVSLGKVALIKKGKPVSESYFFGAGKGFKVKEPTFVFGRTGVIKEAGMFTKPKVSRQFRGKYKGLIFDKAPPTKEYIMGGGKGLSLKSFQYPKEVLKTVQASEVATITSKIKPDSLRFPSPTGLKQAPKIEVLPEAKPTTELSTAQFIKPYEKQKFVSTQTQIPKISTGAKLKTGLKMKEKQKFVSAQTQIPMLKEKQVTKMGIGLQLKPFESSKQKQRLIHPLSFPKPFTPTLKSKPFILPPIVPKRKFGLRTPKGLGKIAIKKMLGYSPSFAGYTFGIKGLTKPTIKLPSGRKIYTGLETRGIPKGKMFKIKV